MSDRCRSMRSVLGLLTSAGVATAHPVPFAAAVLYVIAWFPVEHQSIDGSAVQRSRRCSRPKLDADEA